MKLSSNIDIVARIVMNPLDGISLYPLLPGTFLSSNCGGCGGDGAGGKSFGPAKFFIKNKQSIGKF